MSGFVKVVLGSLWGSLSIGFEFFNLGLGPGLFRNLGFVGFVLGFM